ncbi:MAG: hypothetical protein IT384_29100 [Deltaproteobacteria bacterium]|nr:hypothetical protein [Deltaproteobacteria bacterium]
MAALDVARLEALGFFRYLEPHEARRAAARARDHGSPFAENVHRLYRADAERLAEHGVRDFLGLVAPILRREGVHVDVRYREILVPARGTRPAGRATPTVDAHGWLDASEPSPCVESMDVSVVRGGALTPVTEDHFESGDVYLLYLGDREVIVYEVGEPWDGWRRAACATIALLNELLMAHGSEERAHALSSGNVLAIVFATEEMARIINEAATPGQRLHDGSLA